MWFADSALQLLPILILNLKFYLKFENVEKQLTKYKFAWY